MPLFQYVGAFYKLIHPADETIIGVFGIRFAGTGKTGTGYPNIMNADRRFIWQAKTGGGPGKRMGSAVPTLATIGRAEKVVQRSVNILNNSPGVYIPGWKAGIVTHPDFQRNDLPLKIALRFCGDQCTLHFANKARGVLWVLKGTGGVLAYTVSENTPNPKLGLDPIVVKITSADGRSWQAADFQQKVDAMSQANPTALVQFFK